MGSRGRIGKLGNLGTAGFPRPPGHLTGVGAFFRFRRRTAALWVMNEDGSDEKAVTSPQERAMVAVPGSDRISDDWGHRPWHCGARDRVVSCIVIGPPGRRCEHDTISRRAWISR
jgi:hypothetical protein